jgi:hypothetical protein
LKLINLWNDIEWEWMSKDGIFGFATVQVHFGPVQQFIHPLLSGTRRSLVGGHDNFLETKELVKRPKSHETNGSSTIGVGNELLPLGALSVNFRNYQWNVWQVSKGRLGEKIGGNNCS